MRDKLVSLIQDSVGGCARHWAEVIADSLLAHGAIVPPCKVGQTVYVLTYDSLSGIEESRVERMVIKELQDGTTIKIIVPCVLDDWWKAVREFYPEDFGKTVFLSRAEAEKELDRRKSNA